MDLRPVLILIVALPMGLSAGVLAARAWRDQRRAWAARRWPRTVGRVVASDIRATTVRVRVSTSVGRYRSATRYAPNVVYEYAVGGVPYRSARLHLGARVVASDAGPAERVVRRYPLGRSVTVSYDPSNPAEATLAAQVGWATWVQWLAALVLLAAMIAVAASILSGPPI